MWAALAVIATAVGTESTPPPLTPVAETFVMVVVGFGRVWAAIWRLPAMVGVVDVSFVGAKNGEKRALSSKKSISAPMVFKTTTGESRALGL